MTDFPSTSIDYIRFVIAVLCLLLVFDILVLGIGLIACVIQTGDGISTCWAANP